MTIKTNLKAGLIRRHNGALKVRTDLKAGRLR